MGRQTLASLAEDHFRRRQNRRIAQSTLKAERSSVGKLCRWWDGQRRAPSSLDDVALDAFLYGVEGLAESLSPRSFNTQLAQIRAFMQYLVGQGIVTARVFEIMRPIDYERARYHQVTLPNLVRMVDGADDPFERFILAFSLQTLGREGELVSRQWQHIDLAAGKIEWRRNKTAKTSNGRDELPITADLDREIRTWVLAYQELADGPIQPDWYMIPQREGNPMRRWTYYPTRHRSHLAKVVQKHVSRVSPGLELKGQGAHIMRRSSARALYERLLEVGHPDPARIVQAMLGHASVTTTELYLDIRRDREKRDEAMRGQSLLCVPMENVSQLHALPMG